MFRDSEEGMIFNHRRGIFIFIYLATTIKLSFNIVEMHENWLVMCSKKEQKILEL